MRIIILKIICLFFITFRANNKSHFNVYEEYSNFEIHKIRYKAYNQYYVFAYETLHN